MSIQLLFYIVAIICFLFAAVPVPSKVQWFPLGWAFVICAVISGGVLLR